MIDYPKFEKGQKVKDLHGDVFTVLYQNGCMVFVEELSNGWFHPTKIHAISAVAAGGITPIGIVTEISRADSGTARPGPH